MRKLFVLNPYLCLVETNIERYFIEIAFKGTRYHGWQVQKNALSVQEVLDKALSTVFRQEVSTVGCGRTDAGVHAKQLFAHFDIQVPESLKKNQNSEKSIAEEEDLQIRRNLRGVNALLPQDIGVRALFQVKSDAHARFDALARTYEYHVHFEKDPFLTDFSWQVRDQLNLEKMNKAALVMMEYRDFSCFSKSNTQVFTNNCEITFAEWRRTVEGRIVFEIRANRFLRNMVRAIVGTLVEIGKGNEEIGFMKKVLDSKNRSLAGISVPACGLYLAKVTYPDLNLDTQDK